MGYIRDLERELREMLKELPEERVEDILKYVKDKVYDSYRNGCQRNSRDTKEPKDSEPVRSK